MQIVYRWLTRVGIATSHPLALAAVVAFVALWLIFDRRSFDWQAAATVATLFMTLFIQRAERRNTQAIHAKLDELLRAEGKARNELTTLDEKEPEEIIEHRDQERD
jgi:low affinity Fe/Cu permease